jgi:alkane 1-monooxygenase
VRTLRGSAPYLLSLLVPGTALAFLMADAQRWYIAAGLLAALGAVVTVDRRHDLTPQAAPVSHPWVFEALLYVLAGMQVVNVVALARLGEQARLVDALAGSALVGVSGAVSSGVVAHELIHRRRGPGRWVGRLLLSLTWYEHFFTEHLRGHHARVATLDDPGTARFGETFWQYVLRSWPGEWKSAWQIGMTEARRRGHSGWRNPVLHGLFLESAVTTSVVLMGGLRSLALYVAHVVMATLLVMAVGYFLHWGLRRGPRPSPKDAWGCDVSLTHFVLLGLQQHADHHLHATRPYWELRPPDGSPRLPHGYLKMILLVIFWNAEARRALTAELARQGLSPFEGPVPAR